MHPSSIDVDPVADTVRRFLRLGVVGVGDGQPARQDQMRSQAGVGVRRVVRVAKIDPSVSLMANSAS